MDEKTDKVIFLLQHDCPYCEKAIIDFKVPIEKGIINVIYTDEPESKEILEQIKVSRVPACLIFRAVDKKYDYCTEEEKRAQTEQK
ncbi:MAG: hypothetical protein QXZ12_03930 [Thermoplasmata archaeon]